MKGCRHKDIAKSLCRHFHNSPYSTFSGFYVSIITFRRFFRFSCMSVFPCYFRSYRGQFFSVVFPFLGCVMAYISFWILTLHRQSVLPVCSLFSCNMSCSESFPIFVIDSRQGGLRQFLHYCPKRHRADNLSGCMGGLPPGRYQK